tara:strand:- start:812 stop:2278 length:1467 start_codon:yes stop_codon:yes gene_type:complete
MQSETINLKKDLKKITGMLKTEALLALDFNDALVFSKILGRLHFDNISDLFCDDEFERKIYDKWHNSLISTLQKETNFKNKGNWCHIISRTYAIGGHTRLFNELWKGIGDRQIEQSIIITDKDKGKFSSKNRSQVSVLSGNLAKRSATIYEKACGHDVVLLHIHPDDIGAALAARKLQSEGTTVLFVNHSDHTFSFGTGASDGVLEISATGWKITEGFREAKSQNFIGIPFVSSNDITVGCNLNRSGPILSVGGSTKFCPMGDLNFANFLGLLMDLVPNEVVLIGPNPKDPWWRSLLDKYPTRISIMGLQDPKNVKIEYQRAACYVDSFPFDGGTVFSEAIMSGLPCFGLNKSSASGISPADSLRCEDIQELTEEVAEYLNQGIYKKQIDAVRENIKKNFTTEAVVEKVLQASVGKGVPLPTYLSDLETRGVEHFSIVKNDISEIVISKNSWNKLSFRSRIRMLNSIRGMHLSPQSARLLKRRIIFGL